MNLQKVLARVGRALVDGEELRRLARDVGRELPRRRLEVMREVRAGLAGSTPQVEDAFARGYRTALEDVLAAYEAALEPALEAEAAAEQVHLRPLLRSVLATLRDGPRRPTDVAGLLRKDPGQVSRLLAELRSLGLLEVHAQEALGANERPHRLTARGRHVVAREPAPTLSGQARGVARAALRLASLLAQQGRVWREDFAQEAGGLLGTSGAESQALCAELVGLARDEGLVQELEGGVLVQHSPAGADAVDRQLEEATRARALPPFLRTVVDGLPRRVHCIVVAARRWDAWRRVVSASPEAASRVTVINPADLKTGDVTLPEGCEYDVVFESPSLAAGPLRELTEQHLGGRGRQRFVPVPDPRLAMPGVTALPVQAEA